MGERCRAAAAGGSSHQPVAPARRRGRRDRHREGLRVPARLCPSCRRAAARRWNSSWWGIPATTSACSIPARFSITGDYDEAEAVELIRAQHAELGFLPALWPETWSYTLSQIWQAGLDVVAFDIGAPAERIRATRRGSLLPLGLPPAAACRALLAYRTGGDRRGQPVQQRASAAVA